MDVSGRIASDCGHWGAPLRARVDGAEAKGCVVCRPRSGVVRSAMWLSPVLVVGSEPGAGRCDLVMAGQLGGRPVLTGPAPLNPPRVSGVVHGWAPADGEPGPAIDLGLCEGQFGQNAGVDVGGRVAEQLLNDRQVGAGRKQERRGDMAEVVQPDHVQQCLDLFDLAGPGLLLSGGGRVRVERVGGRSPERRSRRGPIRRRDRRSALTESAPLHEGGWRLRPVRQRPRRTSARRIQHACVQGVLTVTIRTNRSLTSGQQAGTACPIRHARRTS